jgi:hypothetical protein
MMGMDLIVAVAQQRHPERTEADLTVLIANITEPQALALFEKAMQISWNEMHSDDDDDVTEHVQNLLTDAIHSVCGIEYSRSIIVLELDNNTRIAIGGGDSWGDTPSGFDEINFLELWGQW